MVSVAGARYASAFGVAIGVSHVTQDERWVVKASGNTSSSGNVGFTIGAGHQW
ncbi:YadA C-terminal domain-containing protein [Burkholderia sp. THE68]|uniref:YadA C-terminal domain-containing protein n=1 Tax=Burkholderia sp. THE68 TaxID=758782 RepID=UPI001389EE86